MTINGKGSLPDMEGPSYEKAKSIKKMPGPYKLVKRLLIIVTN